MSYFSNISKMFLKNIKEKQESLLQWSLNSSEGKHITNDHFFEEVFRTYIDDHESRKAFVVGKDYKTQYKCLSLDVFKKKSQKFIYFSPAVYWHHRLRTKEYTILNGLMIFDIDQRKDGTDRNFNLKEYKDIIKAELGYEINYAWSSAKTKGNLFVAFKLKPVPGTVKAMYKYEAIAKRIAILIGADIAAVNFNNLYQVPQKGILVFHDNEYDLDDFEFVFEDEDLNDALETERSNQVVSFTEKQIWNNRAIQLLLNAEFGQYRNHAAFTIALLYFAMGKDSDEAYEFLTGQWFTKVNDGRFSSKRGNFKLKEVKSVVKSAYSGRYNGPSRQWVELITGEEFTFNLFRSSYIKKEDGYMNGNEVRTRLINWVRTNLDVPIHQKELASEIGVSYRTLKSIISKLKKEGIIDLKTEKGRYSKGTYFEYLKQTPFTLEIDNSYNETGLEIAQEDEVLLKKKA